MALIIPTYAVIPSEGRPCVHDALAAVREQVDRIILVANNGYAGMDTGERVSIMRDREPRANISRWWNIGLDAVARRVVDKGIDRWNVIILNDDTVVGPGAVSTLTNGLRRHRGDLAFCGPTERVLIAPGPDRITGWCFAVRGESGLRADEDLVWWCGDNDLDWRARAAGGSVMVPGVHHEHLYPNGYTVGNADLNQQAGKDMERFTAKWGRTAW
jgi:GT2 family glycosyltransferase